MNRYFYLTSALVFLLSSCHDKDSNVSSEKCNICKEVTFGADGSQTLPDTFAKYPNGNEGVASHIQSNISYPEGAKTQQIEGRVVVSFIVDIDGGVKDIKVEKAVHEELDNEAVRVVRLMDKQWTPAYKDGQPVRLRYVQPIKFGL